MKVLQLCEKVRSEWSESIKMQCIAMLCTDWNMIAEEIARRGISQRHVGVEASLQRFNIPFSAVSRLLSDRKCTQGQPGVVFRRQIEK
jgi:hypothetical protein